MDEVTYIDEAELLKCETPTPLSPAKLLDGQTHYRCPICVGHLEPAEGIDREHWAFYWDCPKCSIRIKVWRYFKGMR